MGRLKNRQILEAMRSPKAQDEAVSRDGHRSILRREWQSGGRVSDQVFLQSPLCEALCGICHDEALAPTACCVRRTLTRALAASHFALNTSTWEAEVIRIVPRDPSRVSDTVAT